MVATSATRDAANREDFRRMVLATLGAEPEVITGREEAELSFAGAVRELAGDATAPPPRLVVDIGGGSTELVLGDGDGQAAWHSMDVGCVRLTERHLRDDPPDAGPGRRGGGGRPGRARRGPGPTCRSSGRAPSSAWPARSPRWPRSRSTCPATTRPASTTAGSRRPTSARSPSGCFGGTRAERAAHPVMHAGRVDVIGAGALILRVLIEQTGAAEVLVSEHDILDGIAWSALTMA